MDNVSHNRDAAHVFYFMAWILAHGLQLVHMSTNGCVRNIVVFQCYCGHDIEKVPHKFGDVREGLFSCTLCGQSLSVMFWCCETLQCV